MFHFRFPYIVESLEMWKNECVFFSVMKTIISCRCFYVLSSIYVLIYEDGFVIVCIVHCERTDDCRQEEPKRGCVLFFLFSEEIQIDSFTNFIISFQLKYISPIV